MLSFREWQLVLCRFKRRFDSKGQETIIQLTRRIRKGQMGNRLSCHFLSASLWSLSCSLYPSTRSQLSPCRTLRSAVWYSFVALFPSAQVLQVSFNTLCNLSTKSKILNCQFSVSTARPGRTVSEHSKNLFILIIHFTGCFTAMQELKERSLFAIKRSQTLATAIGGKKLM